MQGLRGSHDVEVAGQERQRLDPADDVQPSAKSSGQTPDEFNGAVNAEHFVTGIAQHRSEAAAARSEDENPQRSGTDHPSGCSVWIWSARRSHGGNFSGARPAS
jgi:hypothetical protein